MRNKSFHNRYCRSATFSVKATTVLSKTLFIEKSYQALPSADCRFIPGCILANCGSSTYVNFTGF